MCPHSVLLLPSPLPQLGSHTLREGGLGPHTAPAITSAGEKGTVSYSALLLLPALLTWGRLTGAKGLGVTRR